MIELRLGRVRDSTLRVGRHLFRTQWPRRSTDPAGYVAPVAVYLVEEENAGGEIGQLGGFFDLPAAEQLQARLASEGRSTHINQVAVHTSFQDHESDR